MKVTSKPGFLHKAISAFLVLAGVLIVPPHAWAILGMGDIVSDPASYGYYIEQIAAMGKQTQEAIKQVQTLGGIRTTVEENQRAITGTYNRGMGLINDVERLQKRVGSTPSTLDGNFRKWSGIVGNTASMAKKAGSTADSAADNYYDAREVLDDNFEDPRARRKPGSTRSGPNYSADRQYQIGQSSLKDAIAAAEGTLQALPGRVSTLNGLAKLLDDPGTKNLKDAADLQNRFLAEILSTLHELVAITARLGEAQALQSYTGVNDEAMTERVEEVKAAADRDPVWLHEQELDAAGVHRVDGYYRKGTFEKILNRN
jgi:hypothetical protein